MEGEEVSVWDDIYRYNVWKGQESLSGPGSGTASTQRIRAELLDIVRRLNVKSVIDIGCGDGFWMPDLPGYIGMDIAREPIMIARQRHPERNYMIANFLDTSLKADLIIIRDVIQHLPLADAVPLVHAAYERCEWLIASTYKDGRNVDITPDLQARGWAYDNDLIGPPFNLGDPVASIPDGAGWTNAEEIRDARKFLGVWKAVPTFRA